MIKSKYLVIKYADLQGSYYFANRLFLCLNLRKLLYMGGIKNEL